jgi:predicted kinase
MTKKTPTVVEGTVVESADVKKPSTRRQIVASASGVGVAIALGVVTNLAVAVITNKILAAKESTEKSDQTDTETE